MESSSDRFLPIISAEDLAQLLKQKNVVLIDARSGPDAFQRYAAQHIEGALHIDLEKDLSKKPADASNGGRHPLPDIKTFAALLGKLGIDPSTHVVVYDDKEGSNAAARFWWMLRSLGHEKVQVVDGGLKAAAKSNLSFTDKVSSPIAKSAYPANEWKLPTVKIADVSKASSDPDYLIIDVREGYRFRGESEPIDLVAGHIPNAINLPYIDNLDSDGFFLFAEKLLELYKPVLKNHSTDKVIVHCGSGVTACHTLLVLEQAGIKGANLYVGSWSEWSRNNLPMATGE